MPFYRLTTDPRRQAELAAATAWYGHWEAQADSLGPPTRARRGLRQRAPHCRVVRGVPRASRETVPG